MLQTQQVGNQIMPFIGAEFKSSLLLNSGDNLDFRFFGGTEATDSPLRKYVDTNNPFPQGGVLRALQFTLYEGDFSAVDLSVPTHTYARLAEVHRLLHFAEIRLKYGDQTHFENRKLENFMAAPQLVKPFLASGTIAANTPVACDLVWPERSPIYTPPHNGRVVSGLIPVGQDGNGLVLDDDTALDITIKPQKASGYTVTANLDGLVLCCQAIGQRRTTGGLTRSGV